MKKLIYILSFVLIWSCESESGMDCFKSQGKSKTELILVDEFNKVNISEGIKLIIKQTDEQKVKLIYGENLIDNVSFEVIDNELFIKENSNCGILRNYHSAKVYIEIPHLNKIYSASQYSVKSDGVLTFPTLTLESGIIDETAYSEFDLWIENLELNINSNVSSVYKIKGETQQLSVNFWASNVRLEAEHLKAQKIHFFHRSSNDMIVFPVLEITGKLLSTGDLVLKNTPEHIDIEQLYTGRVVYP